MARVFVSYATPDRAIADEVSSWLRAAGHVPFLDGDLRDGISVGEDWRQRLYRELREVDAVIGVVTSSFVASNWCSAELGIADALGCRLMPVRAETGIVHPLMQDLQYADYQADPQQARDRVLQAVRLLEDGGGTWREGENPFPGLEPFTAALSRVFFGRAAETREVGNRLRAMDPSSGMLAIVGPSGCGKSSLLNAAVVPLLDSDPGWLTVPSLTGGDGSLTASPIVELDDETLAFLDATARRVHAVRERERRRRTRTITVLSTLLVLALIATGLAVWQQQAARSAQRTAIAQAMVARADQVRDRDPRGALQLGVAARHFAASPQTHASLRQTLASNSHFTTFYGHDGTVNGAVFAPDGRTLATTSADETVKLWDVSDRDRPRQLGQPLTGHTDGASGWRLPPMGAPWPPPAMTALSDCGMSVIVSGPDGWVSR